LGGFTPGVGVFLIFGEKRQNRAVHLVAGLRSKMAVVPCCARKQLFARLKSHCTTQLICVDFFSVLFYLVLLVRCIFCKHFLLALFCSVSVLFLWSVLRLFGCLCPRPTCCLGIAYVMTCCFLGEFTPYICPVP